MAQPKVKQDEEVGPLGGLSLQTVRHSGQQTRLYVGAWTAVMVALFVVFAVLNVPWIAYVIAFFLYAAVIGAGLRRS